MKAAVLHGARDVRVEEVDTPQLQAGDVLLRIRACGICGSDLHTYKHGLFPELGMPVGTGRVLGHEFSGEIAEVAGQVEGIEVGDRVTTVSFGGAAEYVRIPALLAPAILRLPSEVSFEEAATNEPLATSLHAVHLAAPASGETAVVIGAGIIGLGVVQALQALCPTRIIVVDLSDKRLAMAKQLGADEVINAANVDPYEKVLEITGSTPISFVPVASGNVDMVFDCAGVTREHGGTTTLEQALLMVKENGRVVLVAVSEKPFGSWAWSLDEFRESLELMRSGKVDRKPLISHEFPLDRAPEAYETQLKAEEAIKVMIKP
jgi:threonine dehydrogenase-like Zn-dependent dehydrogenase